MFGFLNALNLMSDEFAFFFVLAGSSLDLTPSLMTIYDNLAEDNGATETSIKGVTLAVVEPHHPGYVDDGDNVTYSKAEKMTSSSTTNISQKESTTSSLISEECDDGDPAELISGGSDAKKRPLSVSSTSSSSTSSLPRHQRKKIASMVTSPVVSLNNPLLAMDCSIDNGIVASVSCSGVTSESAMEMDVTSDEDDNVTTRGSRYNCDVADATEDNCAKSNIGCMTSDDRCINLDQVSCHEHLEESSKRISFDNNNADSKLCYIEKVVAEILETERTYVRDLKEIIQVSFSS